MRVLGHARRKVILATALIFSGALLTGAAPAIEPITLKWIPPTKHSDGTALAELVSFKIYRGTSPSPSSLEEIRSGITDLEYQFPKHPKGKYWFAVTAVCKHGESSFSNIEYKQIND